MGSYSLFPHNPYGVFFCEATRGDEKLRRRFDTTQNFIKLRLDPYLLTTGLKHPHLRTLFEAEAERIASTRTCLVHGDFSPKNLLVRNGRVVVIDCEVAWFGDPSFDLAFLLNHLHLKALHHAPEDHSLPLLIAAATGAYFTGRHLDRHEAAELNRATSRLLVMLMLARVDGKSPVEYLNGCDGKKDFIRAFAAEELSAPDRLENVESVSHRFFSNLQQQDATSNL